MSDDGPHPLPAPRRLEIASYNIHGCIGGDRLVSPERIAAVIAELRADIVGLQEVYRGAGPGGIDHLTLIAEALDLVPVEGFTMMRGETHYGNALLTRWSPSAVRRIDLSLPRREPRGALDVDIDLPDGRGVRVVVAHLGLRLFERRLQVQRLLEALVEPSRRTLVIAGDFNEWRRRNGATAALDLRYGRVSAPSTFPARRAFLALDRIWSEPSTAMVGLRVHRSPLSRVASDHLPVVATIDCEASSIQPPTEATADRSLSDRR